MSTEEKKTCKNCSWSMTDPSDRLTPRRKEDIFGTKLCRNPKLHANGKMIVVLDRALGCPEWQGSK